MFKKYFIAIILSFAILAGSFVYPYDNKVYAEKQNITYVAFGDSIAEGYAINLKTKTDSESLITGADDSYDIVDGCYVDLVNKKLNENYNVQAYNYAYSGDTCQDLLNYLCGDNGFYDYTNNSVKNGEANNNRYTSLTNLQVYESVKNANIITICIGANNILKEAKTLIPQFLGLSSPSVTRAEMEQKLEKKILGDEESNIKGFKAEFNELLNVLNNLNPNAKIYFTNIYNPYKSLILDSSITSNSLISMAAPQLTQANLNIISDVTELAIAGGTDSSGENFTGLNNVIFDGISNFDKPNNFKFVNSKTLFDDKYDSTNRTGYNQYVNTQLENLTMDKVNFSEIMSNPGKVIGDYIDPHPTKQGHNLIYTAHENCGLEVYLPTQEPEFNYSFKINNQDVLNSYTLSEGESLNIVCSIDNADYTYSYVYTIKQDGTIKNGYNINPITINYQDFSAGEYQLYVSITASKDDDNLPICTDELITNITINKIENVIVSFVTNCETTLSSQTIKKGSKITAPEISRNNYNLVGWFIDEQFTTLWDFNNNITTDLTLYAKWEIVTNNVTFDYNGGKVGDNTRQVVKVEINGIVSKPDVNNTPTLEKYIFIGWFTDLNSDVEFDFSTPIVSDLTIYAKWEKVIFNVTFDYNGGHVGSASQTIVEVNKNNLVQTPTNNPTREDFTFTGWYADINGTQLWDFGNNKITQDVTIFAGWDIKVFYITIDYNGGLFNGRTTETRKVAKGNNIDKIEANGIYKSGYKFCYWYIDNMETELNFPYTPTKDEIIFAYWKEAVNINVYTEVDEESEKYIVYKNSTLNEIYNEIKPHKYGTTFLNWYSNQSLTNKLDGNYVVSNNENLYIRWAKLSCTDENLLRQSYSPITKNVEWHIDANKSSKLKWQVNGEIVNVVIVNGDDGANWTFKPSQYGVGIYAITCLVDDIVVNGKSIEIEYSIPITLSISPNKIIGRRTYCLEVDNKEYYDASKFVWFKTEDNFSNDFSERIGTGLELKYTFASDCKVCVKYLEYEDATDGVTSNSLEIKVDNYVDETATISIVIAVGVIALIVAGMIISRKRYNDYF